ncbi:hypothetical protein BDN67DRAFT_914879, partial [Paxillus ammoniavirescens]
MNNPADQEEIKALKDALRTLARKINELEVNPPTSTERKFSKKFKVVANPGSFEGDRARFSEWWTKIQIWISSNWDGLDMNREVCCAVWSRMKGPIAGRYAETRMIECLNSNTWMSWDNLKIEIVNMFQPQSEKDWAR